MILPFITAKDMQELDKENSKIAQQLGMRTHEILFPHVASMLLGDEIVIQAGNAVKGEVHAHGEAKIQGEGLGQLIKLALMV
jgi:hypothetical protein